MTSQQKFDHAMSMNPFEKKQDIPVFPHTCTYAAIPAGVTQAYLFQGNKQWMEAYKKTCDIVGWPDVAFPLGPKTVTYIEQMPVRIPGKDLDDNALFQFVECEGMKEEDYDLIIEKGFGAWQMPYVASIQNPPFTGPFATFKTILGFIGCGSEIKKNKKFWDSKNIPMMFHGGTAPAFDTFSMSRGMGEFACDLYDCPEKVKAACEKATPEIIKTAINSVKGVGANPRIAIFAMRCSATFISPAMFEEFAWPYLKQMMLAFHEAGITPVLHADGNWLPMLPYFRELPKGSFIIELDGDTDIEKAYEILKGHGIIRGDVPPAIMAFGTAEDVKNYCDKLVNLAMGGGFIIGTGCEVPLNTPIENMKALLNCTK